MEQEEHESQPAQVCPVCGVSMADRDPEGHAYVHFDDLDPTPRRDNLPARQNIAALLGRDIPRE